MKAIQYRSYGDYSENRLVDLPQPALRDGEVLVAMRTVGINPLDNTFRSGHHRRAIARGPSESQITSHEDLCRKIAAQRTRG